MTPELAEHISLLAAPIYAALLAQRMDIIGDEVPAVQLAEMRTHAIQQAQALWLETLATED